MRVMQKKKLQKHIKKKSDGGLPNRRDVGEGV